jgi:hypothetical protein
MLVNLKNNKKTLILQQFIFIMVSSLKTSSFEIQITKISFLTYPQKKTFF